MVDGESAHEKINNPSFKLGDIIGGIQVEKYTVYQIHHVDC